jgi:hypothetical protein
MTDDINEATPEIAAELARIRQLSVDEQPDAFAALRDQLEAMLNDVSGVSSEQQ